MKHIILKWDIAYIVEKINYSTSETSIIKERIKAKFDLHNNSINKTISASFDQSFTNYFHK